LSRIFEALQRLGTEQSGVEYPDMVAVATEVFEAPHAEKFADRTTETAETEGAEAFSSAPGAQQRVAVSAIDFPSLHISVTPASRLVFLSEPDSLAAEKFRFLGVRLRQLRQNRPLKKVLITSTIPEEGKSLVSANLAGVLAQRKQKVLLIEGDLRRPVLAQQFGLGTMAGLGEWLQSGSQTLSNIYKLEGPGFWLMPAGNPPGNPLELMQSGRLSLMMNQLASMFDWIIVDSPPLLPLADTTVWARLTEGTLLVAREAKTERAQLMQGLEMLKKSDLLGVVLNGCSQSDHKNYYQRYSPPAKK
jgi:capsular exopolysaccharide synthesis family protein